MATSIVWPNSVLIPGEVGLNISPNLTSGGLSFLGYEQVVGNSPGRWRVTFGKIDIRTTAQIQAWNALAAQLYGRLVPLLIPIYDKQRRPGGTGVTTIATATAAIASGAVSLSITSDHAPLPGMHFANTYYERLYRLATVGAPTGSVYPCTIWPPVREAMNAGAILEFNAPLFRVRLASDTEMDVDLELLKFGSPSVRFVEDVGS